MGVREKSSGPTRAFLGGQSCPLLHQQYLPDAGARRHLTRIRLLPWQQLFRRAGSITGKSSASDGGRRRQLKRAVIRFLFHVTAGLRYLWEIPRWRRLNKASARRSSSTRRESPAADILGVQSPESTGQLVSKVTLIQQTSCIRSLSFWPVRSDRRVVTRSTARETHSSQGNE